MLELHTRQVDTVDTTRIKRARKNEKEQLSRKSVVRLTDRPDVYRGYKTTTQKQQQLCSYKDYSTIDLSPVLQFLYNSIR